MKSVAISGAVALVALASVARAADLPRPAAATAPVPVFTWTGFYVGAHGGFLWSETDTKLTSVVGSVLTIDVADGTLPSRVGMGSEGPLGGVQAGYNVQFGMFVAGVEADISWTDVDGETIYSAVDRFLFPGAATNSTFRSELEWLGTLRARAGVAFDRAFIYATGGLAAGEVTSAFAVSIPAVGYSPPPWASDDTQFGWTLGAGVEVALTNNISVKGEYLYYDLDNQTIHATDPATFPGQSLDYTFKNDGNLVRGGINFRF